MNSYVNVYPFIEDGYLVVDVDDNHECLLSRFSLTSLFNDFVLDRMEGPDKEISTEARTEIFETVALLRHIARELEKEIDNTSY